MKADKQYIIRLRRELHQIPEIGFDLPKTLAVVRRELELIGLPYTESFGTSSIVATLNEGVGSKTIAIRADYDAALAEVDAADLTTVQTERATIRTERREGLVQRLQDTYGKHYRPGLLTKAERIIDTELGEQPAAEERHSLREQLNTHKQTQEHHPDKKEHDHARGR